MDQDNTFFVLVVDDTEANINIPVATLGDTYDVRAALDGETAMAWADSREERDALPGGG